MKNRINVTEIFRSLHEQEIMDEISNNIEEEFKNGLPKELEKDVLSIMARAKEIQEAKVSKEKPSDQKPSSVVQIDFNKIKDNIAEKAKSFLPLFGESSEFELLAAAPENSDFKWFESIITVAGCDIEINPIGNSTDKVLVTISPKKGDSEGKKVLEHFAGQDIEIAINHNGTTLLSADIYVSPEADEAQGDGVVKIDSRPSTDGKLTIDIVNKK